MAQLCIGTCSWKYPSWDGLVYSAPDGIDYLAEYAQQYNTVEIDQWFWSRFDRGQVSLPRHDDAARYRAAVADDFSFTVKAPNSVRGGSRQPKPVPKGLDYDLWLGPAAYRPYSGCPDSGPGWFHVRDYALGFIAGWGAHPLDLLEWLDKSM